MARIVGTTPPPSSPSSPNRSGGSLDVERVERPRQQSRGPAGEDLDDPEVTTPVRQISNKIGTQISGSRVIANKNFDVTL